MLVTMGAVAVTFTIAWLIGFITGHARGMVEAYEAEMEGNNAE